MDHEILLSTSVGVVVTSYLSTIISIYHYKHSIQYNNHHNDAVRQRLPQLHPINDCECKPYLGLRQRARGIWAVSRGRDPCPSLQSTQSTKNLLQSTQGCRCCYQRSFYFLLPLSLEYDKAAVCLHRFFICSKLPPSTNVVGPSSEGAVVPSLESDIILSRLMLLLPRPSRRDAYNRVIEYEASGSRDSDSPSRPSGEACSDRQAPCQVNIQCHVAHQ